MATKSISTKLEPVAFQAAWPKHLNPTLQNPLIKVAKVFWKIISVVIFPIILVKLLLHHIQQRLYIKLIMPGQPTQTYPKAGTDLVQPGHSERATLATPDKIKLDALFIKNNQPSAAPKAILYTFGNAMQWETCAFEIERLTIAFPEASILIVNPRGIGNSEGVRSPEGHALDIFTAYEYLHKQQKVALKDILLVSHSHGACYGSMGAAHVQKEYPEAMIGMVHGRSYSTFTKEVQAILPPNIFLAKLVKKFPSVIKLLGLEMDSHAAFTTLKGNRCVIYAPHDEVIPYEASLHHRLGSDFCRFETIKVEQRDDAHNAPLSENEGKAFIHFVERTLNLPLKTVERLRAVHPSQEAI